MNEPTITITGNLTADPELRFTKSGAPYVNFTVASTPRTFDRNTNEWRDGETLFLNCSAWREMAENITDSLRKGTRVIVQGRLTSRSYETQNGERRTINEIQVEEIGPSLRNAQAKITRTTQQNTWTQTPQPTTHNTENTQQTWPHPHTTPTNQPAPF